MKAVGSSKILLPSYQSILHQFFFPHIRTLHLDIMKVLFIYPTDALVRCLKKQY